MFAVMKLLFVGLVQPFLPLFWWICLCYEAYLICSPQDVPFVPKKVPCQMSFCHTCCIYSEFQLLGSFKFLDTLSRTPYTQTLLDNASYIYYNWCPTISSCFLLAMRYVSQGWVYNLGMLITVWLCFITHFLHGVVWIYYLFFKRFFTGLSSCSFSHVSLCSARTTAAVPEDLMQWFLHKVIAELIL